MLIWVSRAHKENSHRLTLFAHFCHQSKQQVVFRTLNNLFNIKSHQFMYHQNIFLPFSHSTPGFGKLNRRVGVCEKFRYPLYVYMNETSLLQKLFMGSHCNSCHYSSLICIIKKPFCLATLTHPDLVKNLSSTRTSEIMP